MSIDTPVSEAETEHRRMIALAGPSLPEFKKGIVQKITRPETGNYMTLNIKICNNNETYMLYEDSHKKHEVQEDSRVIVGITNFTSIVSLEVLDPTKTNGLDVVYTYIASGYKPRYPEKE